VAFAAFYAKGQHIIAKGFNKDSEVESQTGFFDHSHENDDENDLDPQFAGARRFDGAADDYNNLVQLAMRVWLAFAGAVFFAWLRFVYRYFHMQHSTQSTSQQLQYDENDNHWIGSRSTASRARHRLLAESKKTYSTIVGPLAMYVHVFVLFLPPAVVMATGFCLEHSAATAATTPPGATRVDITYSVCNVACEFALSFRTVATVAAWVLARDEQSARGTSSTTYEDMEMCAAEPLLHLSADVSASSSSSRRSSCSQLGHSTTLVASPLYEDEEANANSGDAPVSDPEHVPEMQLSIEPLESRRMVAAVPKVYAEWQEIDESNIRISNDVLGNGIFSSVYRGTWTGVLEPVAIKVLKGGMRDAEGNPRDQTADEDFTREASMLQRVKHESLLRVYGFGKLCSGCGFLVAEVMNLGSLSEILKDSNRELPWCSRLHMALRVAEGMEYLHSVPIVHRDLKSPNVLVHEEPNGTLQAKIAGFGSSAHLGPRRPTMPASQKGLSSLVSDDSLRSDTVLITEQLNESDDNVGLVTERWMAPDFLRKSTLYSAAVDVYSFGIILWELATRRLPWDHLRDGVGFSGRLKEELKANRRPAIPNKLIVEHKTFVTIMQACWATDQADRPSFAAVVVDLNECIFKSTAERTPTQAAAAAAAPDDAFWPSRRKRDPCTGPPDDGTERDVDPGRNRPPPPLGSVPYDMMVSSGPAVTPRSPLGHVSAEPPDLIDATRFLRELPHPEQIIQLPTAATKHANRKGRGNPAFAELSRTS